MLGVCAVIWLAVIGVGVAAIVVLVDMGTGRHGSSGGSQTPWLLYVVIAVSALIILGAIPLLLQARRSALAEPGRGAAPPPLAARATGRPTPAVTHGTPVEAPTQKLRVFGSIADPIGREPGTYRPPEPAPRRLAGRLSADALERVLLRASVVTVGVMGVAMLGVATATYLMAVDKDDAAWVAYGFAAVVTIAMPVVPWPYLRQLRATAAARPA